MNVEKKSWFEEKNLISIEGKQIVEQFVNFKNFTKIKRYYTVIKKFL